MRAARSGVIANVSSIGAWAGYASLSMYTASKWTATGFSESLAAELADFGIKVCCIEPGYFRSNLLTPGNRQKDESRIKDYDGTAGRKIADLMDQVDNKQPGDVVLSGKDGTEVPMRLVLGRDGYEAIKQECEETLRLLEEWKDVTCSTDHDDVKKGYCLACDSV